MFNKTAKVEEAALVERWLGREPQGRLRVRVAVAMEVRAGGAQGVSERQPVDDGRAAEALARRLMDATEDAWRAVAAACDELAPAPQTA